VRKKGQTKRNKFGSLTERKGMLSWVFSLLWKPRRRPSSGQWKDRFLLALAITVTVVVTVAIALTAAVTVGKGKCAEQ
jgi:hypothetical protein